MSASPRPSLRVFLDSSALIAGCISREGASFLILRLAEVHLLDVHISPDVREESVRNIRSKAPAALPFLSTILNEVVSTDTLITDDGILLAEQFAHPKDVLILAAALAQSCQYFVTLNERDFWPPPDLIQVVRPGELAQAIRSQIDALRG